MGLSPRAHSYIVGNDVMMGFTFIIVGVRFYVRYKHSRRGLWWDDLFILLSLVFAVAYGASVNISMGHFGWDRNVSEIPIDEFADTIKTYVLAKCLFILASSGVRASLLCFYLWLVRDLGNGVLRWTIYGCMIANSVICLLFCLISVLECRPVNSLWTYPRPHGSVCMNDGVFTITMGAFLCLADLVVNILPIPIVAQLNLPLRRRWSIGALLSLGGVATVAGVVREAWLYRTLISTKDMTKDALPLFICGDVEIYVAMLCACAPALKPLWTWCTYRYIAMCDGRTFGVLRPGGKDAGSDPRDYDAWDVFDGGLTTNVTQIYATQGRRNRSTTGHDSSKDDSADLECNINSVGIQVVTHIQLKSNNSRRSSIV